MFMVTVKLFGMLKILANNQSEVTLALNGSMQVKDLVVALEDQYPEIGELIHKKKVLVSVNQDIAQWDTTIGIGDQVALLPPFAGG